jgi:lipoprotein Spr
MAQPNVQDDQKELNLRFIDDIEIVKGQIKTTVNYKVETPKEFPKEKKTELIVSKAASDVEIENADQYQIKYAIMMDTEIENIKNEKLYQFIEKWMGTPYKYGAQTETGTDCSGFSGNLYKSIFENTLPRTAKMQYQTCVKIEMDEIKEGDLVFFNTRGGVSHVGVYLQNGYFVHASTKEGVIISSLTEGYYKNKFIGAGRPSISTQL